MLIKQIVIVGLVAVVATAQNIAWKGSAPVCAPQSCEKEDAGARPIELRRSKCGDGKCCTISGHKKCCADADNEANRIACQFSDNARHNPESDPDYDDFQIIADFRRNREEAFRHNREEAFRW
ncbi:unnamed protein product [Mortierella alpina]